MNEFPKDGQKVEILVNGEWKPATFHIADYYTQDDGEEVWWLHYYSLEDHTTVPEDIQSSKRLPPWRPKEKTP